MTDLAAAPAVSKPAFRATAPQGVQAAPKSRSAVPRRDKSLSALSHELIQRYGEDGTIIDLDEVQVCALAQQMFHGCVASPHLDRLPPFPRAESLPPLEEAAPV